MTESQNRDLWFTLPSQRSLLVWLVAFFSYPYSHFKISNFIHLVYRVSLKFNISPKLKHVFFELVQALPAAGLLC